jgi:hypothetical protein
MRSEKEKNEHRAQDQIHNGRLAEYQALRAELLVHTVTQRNALVATWTVGAALFTIGVQQGAGQLFLLIPIVTFLFGLQWAHAASSVMVIGGYIQNHIEKHTAGLCWEAYVNCVKRKRKVRQTPRSPVTNQVV